MGISSCRATIIAPAKLTEEANHLALLIGTSSFDIDTFNYPGWRDAQGNLYSVCSTLLSPSSLALLLDFSPESILPEHAEDLDTFVILETLSKIIYLEHEITSWETNIIIALDWDSQEALDFLGLSPFQVAS